MRRLFNAIITHEISRIILRYPWQLILPVVISLSIGIVMAVKLPRMYKANTTIMILPQKVPSEIITSMVPFGIETRINTISQQILSRTNLEKIIRDFGLFEEEAYRNRFIEEKIALLRKSINVDLIRENDRRPAEAFSIFFKGKDPQKVMDITNALADSFIDANVRVREEQALGTHVFLDEELAVMRKRLEEKEKVLKEYREAYMGELPEQLETNLKILDRLMEQTRSKTERLHDGRNRLLYFDDEIQDEYERLLSLTDESVSAEDPQSQKPAQSDAMKLRALKLQLDTALNRYTEHHPDVLSLRKRIAPLEAKVRTHSTDELTMDKAPEAIAQPLVAQLPRSAYLNQLIWKRGNLEAEVKTLQAEIPKLQMQVNLYQNRVENTPKREQELMSLRRDYDHIQQSYSSLLIGKLKAELALNMEKKQKGEQFRLIDPAKLPQKPSEPNMKKLLLLSIVAGLGIGGGLIVLFEFFDHSFKNPDELEKIGGVPVFASFPYMPSAKERLWNRINYLMIGISLIVILFLAFVLALVAVKGDPEVMAIINNMLPSI